jgi:hypothetical protein
MARRVLMSLLSVPFAAAGWLAAHSAAYLLAAPDAHDRAELLSATGHGYLKFAPLFAACGLVLLIAGLLACVAEGVRARAESQPPLSLFVVTPPVAFVLLEHVERLAVHGAVPYDAVLEETFLVGLALQLPFAAAALGLLRGLHRLGHALGRVLRWSLGVLRPLRLAPRASGVVRVVVEPDRPRWTALALGHGQRAPPSPTGA